MNQTAKANTGGAEAADVVAGTAALLESVNIAGTRSGAVAGGVGADDLPGQIRIRRVVTLLPAGIGR